MKTETYTDLAVLCLRAGAPRGDVTYARVEAFHQEYWNALPLANFEWMHNGVYYELLTANVPRDLFKEMMSRYRDLSFLARYHRGYEFAGWLSGAGSKHLTNRAMIREYLRQHLPHREIHAA